MATIQYTYDEKKPTNRDYLIEALTGEIDDGGASYEAAARYDIACPYRSNCDCLNHIRNVNYGEKGFEDNCTTCKLSWLNRRFDTYPSEDGRFIVDEEDKDDDDEDD